jgi:tetratricopeptide (TPR) repeat protein
MAAWFFAAVLPAESAAAEDSGYVDTKLCAGCHRQIADDYSRTGMGRSFYRPGPETSGTDFGTSGEYAARDFYHELSDTHFSMVLRDGKYYQRRWQIGLNDKEINVEELSIDYIMGSGNHARTYLHRTARGTLIELPLGWYADRDASAPGHGRWAMSPGSDSDRPRTRRFISYKCMFCHNGYPRIPEGHGKPGADPVYTSELPSGIDCQRCHGPGGRHVRTVTSGKSDRAAIRASIVNPARLDATRSMEICMQCHLETSSGRIPATLVRFDRGPFAFVPGEPLDAFSLSFDHVPGTGHDEKFEAVSSVYRLRKSECFVKSKGALTCATCHDPHRAPRGSEAVSQYSAACRKCHAVESLSARESHTGSSGCIDCHMPKRRAEDTPGMVMTDHLIQRRPPSRDLVAEFSERPPEEYRGEVVPYYPSPFPAKPVYNLYRAVAQVGMRNNVEAGLPAYVREIEAQRPSEAEFYVVLADAWKSAGKNREAVEAYRRAARIDPKSARLTRALAGALAADGQAGHASGAWQQALALAPTDPLNWLEFGRFELASGSPAQAVVKIGKAIELDPTLPDQHRTMGEALFKAGNANGAREALRKALSVDPYDDAAWDLTGRVLAEKGEWQEAFFHFDRALRLSPGQPTYLYDYALALARADRFDEAEKRARAAVLADPGMADAHELLGGLFARSNRLKEAASAYVRVVELRPGSARARLRLGNVLAAQGDRTAAVPHLREAAKSGDASISQQAAEALRRIGAQ